ncbi:MAG TPA: hypothetical protein VK531_01415 [Gemmatimonadales bacterium]|nr:hypothetical protein [Gemmatimonadales bacterium]
MAFSLYSELVDGVLNWLDRKGDTEITSRIPDWIALCEARIRRQQEWFSQFYSLANSGAMFSVTANPFELPSYVRDVKAIWNSTQLAFGEIEIRTPATWRGFVSINSAPGSIPQKAVIVPQMDSWLVDPDGAGGATKHGAKVYLWPTPLIDGSILLDFEYIRDLDPLTPGTTNGLFLRHPDLYLFGTLVESAPYLQHDERLPLWESRFNQAMTEINTERERAKFSASRKRPALPRAF